MTIDNMRLFTQGKDYWWEYQRINGWATEPNDKGLKALSRDLDVGVPWLRKCINIFLEA